MESKSSDLTVDIESRETCQPCKEQGHERTAMYWCFDCPDLLCKNCYDHHKVLKGTRNHKLLGIDEYQNIGADIVELNSNCKHHPKNLIEYLCLTHNMPCCVKCKSEVHGVGCDVKTKEDILKGSDQGAEVINTIETINRLIDDVEKSASVQGQNTSQLEEQRSMFYEKLRSGRDKIDQFLDGFEDKLKDNFEIMITSSREKIIEHIKILDDMRLNLIKRRETVQRVQELENFQGLKLYLMNNKFHRYNANEQSQLKSIGKELYKISCISEPVFEVDEESKVISLIDVFKMQSTNKTPTQVECTSDDLDVCSSTVELEVEEFGTSSSTVEADENLPPGTIEADENLPPGTIEADENLPPGTIEADENLPPGTVEAEDESDTPSSRGWWSEYDSDSFSSDEDSCYELTEHFFIERRNKKIRIICARFVEFEEIVMTETSEKRLLVYKMNGQKKGQIMLKYEPAEIAVFGYCVAVAAQKTLVFIDTDKMKIYMEKDFPDFIHSIGYANVHGIGYAYGHGIGYANGHGIGYANGHGIGYANGHGIGYANGHGIGYANGQIFVCFENKGMNVLDCNYGNILRYIPYIRGKLYICPKLFYPNEMEIYTAKCHSNKIFYFCEDVKGKKQYHYDTPLDVYGMTRGKDDNIYFATKSQGIVQLDPSTETFSTILSADDGVNAPCSVDYQSAWSGGKLLIIDNGKEVKVFSK